VLTDAGSYFWFFLIVFDVFVLLEYYDLKLDLFRRCRDTVGAVERDMGVIGVRGPISGCHLVRVQVMIV
jgi:hypothetical protein